MNHSQNFAPAVFFSLASKIWNMIRWIVPHQKLPVIHIFILDLMIPEIITIL